MKAIVDTCFLIDLDRLTLSAIQWANRNPDSELVLCPIVYAEFAAGLQNSDRLLEFAEASGRIEVDFETAQWFSILYRKLRRGGQMVGANDLWIAALAVQHDLPVLTRNLGEFDRVPGLRVVTY